MERGTKFLGAICRIYQAMEGTEFQSRVNILFWSRKLVLSLLCLEHQVQFYQVIPCYLIIHPRHSLLACLSRFFVRVFLPSNGSHIIHGIQPSKKEQIIFHQKENSRGMSWYSPAVKVAKVIVVFCLLRSRHYSCSVCFRVLLSKSPIRDLGARICCFLTMSARLPVTSAIVMREKRY
jgi:hypothetical protein